jgi:hypothetical protein
VAFAYCNGDCKKYWGGTKRITTLERLMHACASAIFPHWLALNVAYGVLCVCVCVCVCVCLCLVSFIFNNCPTKYLFPFNIVTLVTYWFLCNHSYGFICMHHE